jgi:hypothetical protein
MNVEYKAFDGSTNPHLALAAIVAAGMMGELRWDEQLTCMDVAARKPSWYVWHNPHTARAVRKHRRP